MTCGYALFFAMVMLVLHGCNAQAPSCIGLANGYTINDATNTNDYYTCMNSVPIPMQCPSGYVFCSGASSCTASCSAAVPVTSAPVTSAPTTAAPTTAASVTSPTVTTVASTVCTGQDDGSIFPNPSSCSGYYLCTNGIATSGSCLDNLAFQSSTGTCSSTVCTN